MINWRLAQSLGIRLTSNGGGGADAQPTNAVTSVKDNNDLITVVPCEDVWICDDIRSLLFPHGRGTASSDRTMRDGGAP